MPTTLTNGIQLPDKGSVDWYNSMQSNYNLIDTHLGNTDIHVTAEDKANWDSKQGSLSQTQLDAIAQVATNTSDIATLQSGKADVSHTHSSSDITDIGDYATKQYVDTSISGLVDNAPDALNTLNELSAALNDDSNFATTVTTALSAKANSADLATVATSGSYDDLTDTPTIPTNTSDLTNDSNFVVSSSLATVATSGDYDDLSNKPTINNSTITIQKNGSTVDTFTTNGSAKTINIPVPTKTSDLTNDSNFVDTSNSAVASGITSAKVTSYDSHIADTDIHVTTADKTKWNNGVTQAYVLRYSSTAITDNSTIAYSTLDNTDNIKVSDKIIDTDGKIFSVVSVDSDNSTVTVGNALIDLALDANVMHLSGDENVNGTKTFKDMIPINGDYLGNEASTNQRTNICLLSNRDTADKSCAYISRFRQNKSQGALQTGDLQMIGFDVLENEVRTNNVFSIQCSGWVDNVPTKVKLLSTSSDSTFGSSIRPSKINDLNPGALSLPDLSNGLDISGYINTGNSDNSYTPTVDGYISIKINSSTACAMYAVQGDFYTSSFGSIVDIDLGGYSVSFFMPVKKNAACRIVCRNAGTIVSAKFFPCLGNV